MTKGRKYGMNALQLALDSLPIPTPRPTTPVCLMDDDDIPREVTRKEWSKHHSAFHWIITRMQIAAALVVFTVFIGWNMGTDAAPIYFLTLLVGAQGVMMVKAAATRAESRRHERDMGAA